MLDYLKQCLSENKPDSHMYGNINYNKFDYLFHEMGHMIDFKTQTRISKLKIKSKIPKFLKNR